MNGRDPAYRTGDRGDGRQERRAATDDDRVAKHAQLVDEAELDRRAAKATPPIETSLSVTSSAVATSSASDASASRALA